MATEGQLTGSAAIIANSQEAAIVPTLVPELGIGQAVALVLPIGKGAALVLAIVPGAALALGIDQAVVVPELPIGQAVGALEHDPGVAVLELGREEAMPGHGHRRDRQAVPLETKSVTVAHHLGQVPHLVAGEDSAVAAAETMREPAAAEAVAAWVVAE
jgi:hypothetical protein